MRTLEEVLNQFPIEIGCEIFEGEKKYDWGTTTPRMAAAIRSWLKDDVAPKKKASEPVYNGKSELIRYDPTPKEIEWNACREQTLKNAGIKE